MVKSLQIWGCRSNVMHILDPQAEPHKTYSFLWIHKPRYTDLPTSCKLNQHEGVVGPYYIPTLPQHQDWPAIFCRSHALVPINVFAGRGSPCVIRPTRECEPSLSASLLIENRFMWTIAFILMNEQSCFRANGFKLCNATFIVFNKTCPFWHSLPEYPSSTFLYGSMVLIPGATSDQEANWK